MPQEARHRGFVDEVGRLSQEELDRNPPLAATADIMKIYEEAVQEPLIEVTNLDSLYSNAQDKDTDRYDAITLREDFCSTAIVANSWLTLNPKNEAQGVDIDLDALQDTQRRYGAGAVRILQSPAFSRTQEVVELVPPVARTPEEPEAGRMDSQASNSSGNHNDEGKSSTWAPGAASDRFERRFQARLSKERTKTAKTQTHDNNPASQGLRLTLLHSDVLDLPLPSSSFQIPPPDLVATLNYGLCYFHDRHTLIRYLTMCARTLRPKTGVLICDQWGGPATGETYPPDQEGLWAKFESEVGFARKRASSKDVAGIVSEPAPGEAASPTNMDKMEAALLRNEAASGLLAIYPAPDDETRGTPAEWPRGKLKLVRKGKQHGGFEYWREDGPIDYMTNRFRMGLSFRFSDGSWIRDFFSYDFRIWSLKEVTEAMLEAGFKHVAVHVLPRNVQDDEDALSDTSMRSRPASPSMEPDEQDYPSTSSSATSDSDSDSDFVDMAHLMRQTEKEERGRAEYHKVGEGEKVFATRSFGTYIIARVG